MWPLIYIYIKHAWESVNLLYGPSSDLLRSHVVRELWSWSQSLRNLGGCRILRVAMMEDASVALSGSGYLFSSRGILAGGVF